MVSPWIEFNNHLSNREPDTEGLTDTKQCDPTEVVGIG